MSLLTSATTSGWGAAAPYFQVVSVLAFCLVLMGSAHAQITDALGVRSLSAEQADEGRPVKLRGSIIFIEAPGTVFVQDTTAGTFFRTKMPLGDLKLGDVIEVEGTTFPGLFLPGIETTNFQVVASGEMPKAQPVGFDELISARYHYQRVQVEGMVRSVTTPEENRSVLRLAMGSRVIELRINQALDEEGWIGAQLRVHGLAAGAINDRRQLVQPYLKVSDATQLEVVKPASDPAKLPLEPASNILRFDAAGTSSQRVRVQGGVLATFADGHVFVRDQEAALAVKLNDVADIQLGDVIDAAGFPEMERFSASLADAMILSKTPGEAVLPVVPTTKDLMSGVHDNDLIRIQALLTGTTSTLEGEVLMVQMAGHDLRARLPKGERLDLAPNTQLQLTGICRVETTTGKGFNSQPETLSLWLRSVDDVQVLRAPSWWTTQRLLTALSVLIALMLASACWILLLRRQVSALRVRIQREAVLEERQRIAREFHDTLEQELAGLRIRLDAAATRPLDDKARSLVEASQGLISRIQTEARNLVSDLRAYEDSGVDLPNALHELAERQTSEQTVVHFEDTAALPEMPGHVAHHLRMIAQEALTNSLKHAQATKIEIELFSDGTAMQLVVKDNGQGFTDAQATHGQPGHFGCMGIRERCRKIGAEVDWQSTPGQGTAVTVHWSTQPQALSSKPSS